MLRPENSSEAGRKKPFGNLNMGAKKSWRMKSGWKKIWICQNNLKKKTFLCCHKTQKSSIVTSVFKPCTKLCTGLCTGIVRSPPSIKCWVVSGPANREEMSKRCGYASADGPFTHLLIKSTILGPETQSFAHGAYFSWFKFMIQHLKLIKKWLDSSISFLAGGLEHFFSIYLEESSQLINIFQRGWNHQLAFFGESLLDFGCLDASQAQRCPRLGRVHHDPYRFPAFWCGTSPAHGPHMSMKENCNMPKNFGWKYGKTLKSSGMSSFYLLKCRKLGSVSHFQTHLCHISD